MLGTSKHIGDAAVGSDAPASVQRQPSSDPRRVDAGLRELRIAHGRAQMQARLPRLRLLRPARTTRRPIAAAPGHHLQPRSMSAGHCCPARCVLSVASSSGGHLSVASAMAAAVATGVHPRPARLAAPAILLALVRVGGPAMRLVRAGLVLGGLLRRRPFGVFGVLRAVIGVGVVGSANSCQQVTRAASLTAQP